MWATKLLSAAFRAGISAGVPGAYDTIRIATRAAPTRCERAEPGVWGELPIGGADAGS